MPNRIDLINLLISQGKIKIAIEQLSKIANSGGREDLRSELPKLSARFNNNEKKKRTNVISEADYNLEWNKILDALTSLVQEYQENVSQMDSKDRHTKNTATSGIRTVFISYNHNDQEVAFKIQDALKSNGLDVIIDVDSTRAGVNIKEAIEDSIGRARVTLCIISNHSLLSGWVGMEIINTFFHVRLNKERKFIACYLDDDFFDREFTLKAVNKIEQDISKIENLMSEYAEKKLDTGDLNSEKTRLYDLRNNIDKIVGRLRESLCVDIRGEKLEHNLHKILEAITVIGS